MTAKFQESDIETLLAYNGELSRSVPGFVERDQQIAMAIDIWRAINAGSTLLAEAGTGTGKTYAYLVPALLAGGRTIISTGTKTLQDQLFYKDLPVVKRSTGSRKGVALLKGRSNYLCPVRLDKHLEVLDAGFLPHVPGELNRVREWSFTTTTGDVTEVLDMEAEPNVVPLITSNVDNCLGGECPRIHECPLYAARGRAFEADIVVVNHHLLFADLAMQDDSVASLLPAADTVVIDEAHQVEDIARQFFGTRLGSGQLAELCRDIRTEVSLLGNDEVHLLEQTSFLERCVADLLSAMRGVPAQATQSILETRDIRDRIDAVDVVLGGLAERLGIAGGRSRSLANCCQRAFRLLDRFALLTESIAPEEGFAHWVQLNNGGFVIHLAPVSIAEHFGARVVESRQSWIMTSATLTINDSFEHVRQTLGLKEVEVRRYASPFDFAKQVKGWLPGPLPRPGGDDHTMALVELCLPVIRRVKGRTFFLFTSYRALNVAATCLASSGIACLVQGRMSRTLLLDRFRSVERCALLATYSFWEGVDVRGADLQCLIIDKLPFANPDDPVISARMRAMTAEGRNGFMDCLLPEAAITLRQGFGRLVRQETDRGLFILGDPRFVTQAYGAFFRNSLPELEWIAGQAEAIEYVEELAIR